MRRGPRNRHGSTVQPIEIPARQGRKRDGTRSKANRHQTGVCGVVCLPLGPGHRPGPRLSPLHVRLRRLRRPPAPTKPMLWVSARRAGVQPVRRTWASQPPGYNLSPEQRAIVRTRQRLPLRGRRWKGVGARRRRVTFSSPSRAGYASNTTTQPHRLGGRDPRRMARSPVRVSMLSRRRCVRSRLCEGRAFGCGLCR